LERVAQQSAPPAKARTSAEPKRRRLKRLAANGIVRGGPKPSSKTGEPFGQTGYPTKCF